MNLVHIIVPAALAALAATGLSAAEPAFGAQGALAFPANDLTDAAATGIQLGGHARWNFGNGHGLMARGDLGFYGSKDGFSTSSFGVGADYQYHLDGNRLGFYLLAGVTYTSYSVSGYGHSSTHSGLGPDLGIGYDLDRHLGLQVRYTTHDVDSSTLSSLNLGVTYTF